jgi:tRNA-Thr(GGU) m(6)t(6)A37 methyltransferase TsaA
MIQTKKTGILQIIIVAALAILIITCMNQKWRKKDRINFQSIGLIHSPYTQETGAPRQGRLEPDTPAKVELFKPYRAALQGLDRYDYIWLIYHFDRVRNWDTQVTPPHSNPDEKFGLFATRTPKRPNPVGLCLVKLDSIQGPVLHIRGIDAYDGTPVLDIKPYLPSIDQVNSVRNKDVETDLGLNDESNPK